MKVVDLTPVHKFEYNQTSNHGFEFALLNPYGKALHGPVSCKDYFQDIFWSEYTGREGAQYGLEWKPGRVDMTAPVFSLAVKGGAVNMRAKIPQLQEFLNHFETALEFPHSAVDETESPYIVVVTFPREWTESGMMVSAFTTLIRLAGAYPGGDPVAYLKTVKFIADACPAPPPADPPYMTPECLRIIRLRPRLAALLKGKRPKPGWGYADTMYTAHYQGVLGDTSFPTVNI